jgi:hypothetical protein
VGLRGSCDQGGGSLGGGRWPIRFFDRCRPERRRQGQRRGLSVLLWWKGGGFRFAGSSGDADRQGHGGGKRSAPGAPAQETWRQEPAPDAPALSQSKKDARDARPGRDTREITTVAEQLGQTYTIEEWRAIPKVERDLVVDNASKLMETQLEQSGDTPKEREANAAKAKQRRVDRARERERVRAEQASADPARAASQPAATRQRVE